VLTLPTTVRVFAATEPVDGRKGIDGLAGVVRAALQRDPLNGDLYLFLSRRRDRARVLYFANNGYWLLIGCGSFAVVSRATSCEAAVVALIPQPLLPPVIRQEKGSTQHSHHTRLLRRSRPALLATLPSRASQPPLLLPDHRREKGLGDEGHHSGLARGGV
jgi:hypothetical protein